MTQQRLAFLQADAGGIGQEMHLHLQDIQEFLSVAAPLPELIYRRT